MSKRFVIILWSLVAVLALLTFIVKATSGKGSESPTQLEAGAVLLQKLPLADVTTIAIEGAHETLTLRKDENQWSVAERDGYEADFAKLARLLRSLTEAKVTQSRAAGTAFNARFGMDGEAANQEDHGYQISFRSGDGKDLETIFVGKSAAGENASGGRYVRLASEPEAVYAINDTLSDLTVDATQWLASDFIQVEGIKSIAFTPGEDDTMEAWSVSRPDADSDFQIADLSPTREVQEDQLSRLKNALSAPQFEDVVSAEKATQIREPNKQRQLVINTFDGFQYTLDYSPLKAANADSEASTPQAGDFVVKLKVSAELPSEREKAEEESEEEAKAADEAFATRRQELEEKLAREQAFTKHHYTLADYTLSALNVGLGSLAKPVVKSEAIAPTVTPAQPGPLAPAEEPASVTTPPIQVPAPDSPAPGLDQEAGEPSEEEEDSSLPPQPRPEADDDQEPSTEESAPQADAPRDLLEEIADEDIRQIVEQVRNEEASQDQDPAEREEKEKPDTGNPEEAETPLPNAEKSE
ncbi:DUF4340 domain-containing protein [Roseibacillus ishigakijimensis]|uniref:DUF4340 domain-containing protein n=1 Tax=Roseibacillus ishigakijimensis TaxID=454146 RepID=A0A934RRA0_9BACT|nr:DUF4340 domain-containing protein [Roseibacillus ishigakijimensis]MBK1835463.1 DUF4340 domain-containing protein [Roseibacillus ishigakijimensis]